jgi:hypothetical protein
MAVNVGLLNRVTNISWKKDRSMIIEWGAPFDVSGTISGTELLSMQGVVVRTTNLNLPAPAFQNDFQTDDLKTYLEDADLEADENGDVLINFSVSGTFTQAEGSHGNAGSTLGSHVETREGDVLSDPNPDLPPIGEGAGTSVSFSFSWRVNINTMEATFLGAFG